MSDPMLKLQIIARSELALAQLRTRRSMSRAVLFVVALVFALLGLGMINFSAYQAMVVSYGSAQSALYVALSDMALAGIIILAAQRAGPSENEEKLARELRDYAYSELNSDINQVKSGFAEITSDVKQIRSGFSAFSGGAISSLSPLLSLLIKTIKK
ncbi:MAG: hypothetical protein GQ529_06815 [Methyloprofundus sp.]|nr:hypothetical protein [Methyloprofundus sp.]